MGLFRPSVYELQRLEQRQQKEAERKEKRMAKLAEEEKLNASLRGKPLKQQFLMLSKRQDFWTTLFIIILGIFIIIAKFIFF